MTSDGKTPADRIEFAVVLLSAVIAVAILTLDLLLPLGPAAAVSYLALVATGVWYPRAKHTIVLAVVASLLTISGALFSPEGGVAWVEHFNRAMALFAVWVTTALIYSRKHSTTRHVNLASQMESRSRELEKSERLRKAMEDSEETLLDIIHNSPIAIGITDESGKPVYWNPLFRHIGIRQKEEAANTGFQLSFANPNIPKQLHQRFMDGESVRDEEVELITSEGNSAWVEMTIQNLVFEGQRSILTWLYDVTERKAQQEAIIAERLQAERANLAKSQFLANMSHEIRTPMNGILGMAEMLEKSDLTEAQNNMVTIVHDSAAGLLGIINNILDFSKIEAEKLEMEEVSFSLGDLIDGLIDLVGHRPCEKGLGFFTLIGEDVPDRLIGDPVRLRQILVNLCDNALKFTDEGEIKVSVSLETLGQDEATLLFSVADTGIGIAPEEQTGLFQPFEQADKSTERRFGGTGLGLSISRALVEMMEGEIGVDSERDAGSTF